MKVLGIETSCDETAVAVIEDGRHILSSVVASQVDIHRRYGGVVPEVASRQHILTILPVLGQALAEAGVGMEDIQGIAVTNGPGLAGSLLVGVNAAKGVAFSRRLPLTAVNHVEAHIYAAWLTEEQPPAFPCLCLIVSGGHTDLILMAGHGKFATVGRTRDEAAGEAFDKVARILALDYPGGPAIEQASRQATLSFPLPRAWLKGTHDFSFSGLKTALLHLVRTWDSVTPERAAGAAASFQEAVVDVLVDKTLAAARELDAATVLVGGGVAANTRLARRFRKSCYLPLVIPPPHLCTDNAAMVAGCGYYHFQLGRLADYSLDVVPGLSLG